MCLSQTLRTLKFGNSAMIKFTLIFMIVIVALLLFVSALDYVVLGGSYFESIKQEIYQKTFLESDCRKKGGVVVSSNEIEIAIVHYPKNVCAYPYTDAEKECYDNKDCQGACILWRLDGNEHNDKSVLGRCQKYRNDMLGCVTERRNGKIITNRCLME